MLVSSVAKGTESHSQAARQPDRVPRLGNDVTVFDSCRALTDSQQFAALTRGSFKLAMFFTSFRQLKEFSIQRQLMQKCPAFAEAAVIVYNNNPKIDTQDLVQRLKSFPGVKLLVKTKQNVGYKGGPIEALDFCYDAYKIFPFVIHAHPDVLYINCTRTLMHLDAAISANTNAAFFVTPIMGGNTRKYMKRKIGHVVPGYSFDWFAFKPKMLNPKDTALHNLFSGRNSKALRKKTSGIGEALLPAIIASSGNTYMNMAARGTLDRGKGCFEDGIGLSHCHHLSLVSELSPGIDLDAL